MSTESVDESILRACAALDVKEPKNFQRAALQALLEKRDVFLAYPTGSGKSIIFQALPKAFELYNGDTETECCVLVIQPIIALMTDQIKKLSSKNIRTLRLMHAEERDYTGKKVKIEEILEASIIFASPEALLDTYRKEMKDTKFGSRLVGVAVDESHMIAKW